MQLITITFLITPCLQDPTQGGLYGNKRWLEALNLGFRKSMNITIYVEKKETGDQMRSFQAADLRLCFRLYKVQIKARRVPREKRGWTRTSLKKIRIV